MKKVRTAALLTLALATTLMAAGAAVAHPGQHDPNSGHLFGSGAWGNVELVSSLTLHDAEHEVVADVGVFGNYAYLARWGGSDCAGPETGGRNSPDGGVYVVDISNPAQPREVNFIPTSQDTLVGEGVQIVHLSTRSFSGDVLVMNHETCGKNGKAGMSLWDVTNPLKAVKLSEHFGDLTVDGGLNRPHGANQTHSAFMWQSGDRAYVVATDDDEEADVDILEITNPRKPTLVAELNMDQYGVAQPELGLTEVFQHDMVVKRIGERFILMLSYWDGGYVVVDVTDPARARFLGDSDYAPVDPELFKQTGVSLTPEGNGHQSEFTLDNRYLIATDEDFGPFRLLVSTDEGKEFRAKQGTNTSRAQAEAIRGTTIFVGRACPGDAAVPAAPPSPTPQIAVVERGVCFFTDKANAVALAGGYESIVIMNREGSDACTDVFTPSVAGALPVVFVGRDTGFDLFDRVFDASACTDATQTESGIPLGSVGDTVTSISSSFDGWGYVHLFGVGLGGSSATLTDLDTFAVPEAMNPSLASGYGDLSVHEVATDLVDPSRAYLSYYAAGMRALKIETKAGACRVQGDTAPCLVETGGYLDRYGNNFWGVETQVRGTERYVFTSDMDGSLWIFRIKA